MSGTIIAVVGMCGTGKSEVVSYIERTIVCKKIYFGGIVLQEVQKRGYPLTSEYERIVKEDIRALHGPAAIAHIALPQIQELYAAGNTIVIDGVYSFSEYTFLKEVYGDALIILAVHAPKKLRYERLTNREHRPLTRSEVDMRDYTEITYIEKGGPIAIADRHVINDDTLAVLYNRLDALFALL